jgi:uncharacterized HhH-GPD family protein
VSPTVRLAQDAAADALLSRDPLSLLVGMLLDQQVAMEWAFAGPYLVAQRLGRERLDAHELAGADPEELATLFAGPPAVHRYPKAMAGRVQALCAALVERYDGDVTRLWREAADGRDLRARLEALPGFGRQKSQIFVALLGKQYGVRPDGWREAAGAYGDDGVHMSVADVTDEASLGEVRAYKREVKAARKAASEE